MWEPVQYTKIHRRRYRNRLEKNERKARIILDITITMALPYWTSSLLFVVIIIAFDYNAKIIWHRGNENTKKLHHEGADIFFTLNIYAPAGSIISPNKKTQKCGFMKIRYSYAGLLIWSWTKSTKRLKNSKYSGSWQPACTSLSSIYNLISAW